MLSLYIIVNIYKDIVFSLNLDELTPLLQGKKVFAIIDKKVDFLYGDFLPFTKIIIEASEKNKKIETVDTIIKNLIELGADRDCFILGIGGGIITDIAGFTASIYKRGVQFGFVPTTFLAQVDAAIGGKNGVNTLSYKNMVGTITLPDFIFSYPGFLSTLDQKNYNCGIAEMLKTFIISDEKMYHKAVSLFKRNPLYNKSIESELIYLIKRTAQIKCKIVNKDIYEQDKRRLLNLGHTFAHAIEKNSDDVTHGEAVSIGTIIASKISTKLGILDPIILENIISDYNALSLPVTSPVEISKLYNAISKDKKKEGNKIHFILPTKIGSVKTHLLSIEELKSLSLDF